MAINVTGQALGVFRGSDQEVVLLQGGSYRTAQELGIDPESIAVPTKWQDGMQMIMSDTGWVTVEAAGVVVDYAGNVSFDSKLTRTNNATLARLIYENLPKISPFGRQLPVGGVYYDANYVAADSDGTINRPFKTLDGLSFNTPGQIVNLKRGGVFMLTVARVAGCIIAAKNVQFRAYGDATLAPPLVTAMREVTGFTLVGAEYVVALPQAATPNCMAVAFADQMPNVLINGTAGSLTSGQCAWAGGNLYLKDNPTGRKVYASVAAHTIWVQASGFRMDSIQFGYSSNNSMPILSTAPAGIVSDVILRDTACWYSGNNGIGGGDVGKGATNVTIIRHMDVGAYNNGINGLGDDSNWTIIEPVCSGRLRVQGLFAGYRNDAVTAHGTGLGPWIVCGGLISNCNENAVDIVGGGVGGNQNVHSRSMAMYNHVYNCNEIGMLIWNLDYLVHGNIVTDCGQDAIRLGNQAQVAETLSGEASYNFSARCGLLSGAAGIQAVQGGAFIHHNTMVISPTSTRTAMGAIDAVNNSGVIAEDNIFVLEKDLAVLQFSTSVTTVLDKFKFRRNAYIIPSGNAVLPFQTGGSPLTFTQWQAQREMNSRSFSDISTAGLSGNLYAPSISSSLAIGQSFSSPAYDINARYVSGCVGASGVAGSQ